jgi:hypothetical protein
MDVAIARVRKRRFYSESHEDIVLLYNCGCLLQGGAERYCIGDAMICWQNDHHGVGITGQQVLGGEAYCCCRIASHWFTEHVQGW